MAANTLPAGRLKYLEGLAPDQATFEKYVEDEARSRGWVKPTELLPRAAREAHPDLPLQDVREGEELRLSAPRERTGHFEEIPLEAPLDEACNFRPPGLQLGHAGRAQLVRARLLFRGA